MDINEAYDILKLPHGASSEEVIHAYHTELQVVNANRVPTASSSKRTAADARFKQLVEAHHTLMQHLPIPDREHRVKPAPLEEQRIREYSPSGTPGEPAPVIFGEPTKAKPPSESRIGFFLIFAALLFIIFSLIFLSIKITIIVAVITVVGFLLYRIRDFFD